MERLLKATRASIRKVQSYAAYPAGAVLFREGERPAGVYVLQSGLVRATLRRPDGTRTEVRKLVPGELLALEECLAGKASVYTAEAATNVVVTLVDRRAFLSCLLERPGVWPDLASLVCSDLENYYRQLRGIHAREGGRPGSQSLSGGGAL